MWRGFPFLALAAPVALGLVADPQNGPSRRLVAAHHNVRDVLVRAADRASSRLSEPEPARRFLSSR
jgi:hypothetical protein